MTLPSCSQDKKSEEVDETTSSSDVTTTYYLIRHAEKVRKNKLDSDPHLTRKGKIRSKNWAHDILGDVKFDAVYSTDYHRTRTTAEPTAKKQGHELILYDPLYMDIEGFKIAWKP